jgi:REP element-mobilizing transposase RayT
MEEGLWKMLGFVVMPDHFHVVVLLKSARTLSKIMESIDRFVGIKASKFGFGNLWQDGFHDHLIRPNEDVNRYLTYTHMNPVVKNLVEHPEGWPYSSAFEEYREKVTWE